MVAVALSKWSPLSNEAPGCTVAQNNNNNLLKQLNYNSTCTQTNYK